MARVAPPYLTLMASLPWLPPLQTARHLPISRRLLERRLEMLEPADAGLLHRIESVVQWDRLGMHDSDPEIVRAADALLPDVAERGLRDYLVWRLEVRSLVAAMRRRAAGQAAPARDEVWGVGPAIGRIRRHWAEPDFGMGRSHPWLAEARDLYAEGDTLGLEQRLIELVWQRTGRAAEGHEFDFAAVAFYLLRWHLLQRWTSYDRHAAARRFAALLDEALERPAVHELGERLA